MWCGGDDPGGGDRGRVDQDRGERVVGEVSTADGLAHQIDEEQLAFAELAGGAAGCPGSPPTPPPTPGSGPDRGDELPRSLRARRDRLAALEAAKADLAGRKAAVGEAMLGEQKNKRAAYDQREEGGQESLRAPTQDEVVIGAKGSREVHARAACLGDLIRARVG